MAYCVWSYVTSLQKLFVNQIVFLNEESPNPELQRNANNWLSSTWFWQRGITIVGIETKLYAAGWQWPCLGFRWKLGRWWKIILVFVFAITSISYF